MATELLSTLGTRALDTFWIPLAGWSVAALVGVALLRGVRSLHPLTGYRLGQALLLSLPVGIVLRGFFPSWIPRVGGGGDGRPGFVPEPGQLVGSPIATPLVDGVPLPPSVLDLPPLLLGAGVVLASAAAAVGLLRVGRSLREVRRLGRGVEPVQDREVLSLADDVLRQVGVSRPVSFALGPEGSVPMTFGWRDPVVVVPSDLLSDPESLRMALQHEVVHVRRRDYPWAVAEATVAALFACHPLMPALARAIVDLRERSCDVEVTSALEHPGAYGELLVTMAGRVRSQLLVAAGIAPPPSKLRQRLETMSRHLEASHSPARGRLAATAAILLALSVSAVAACAPSGPDVPEPVDELTAEELTSRFGTLTDETRDETLRRLDVQMTYLVGRIETLRDTLVAREAAGDSYPQHLREQYDLLNRMYIQRLETYETLKLEAETERLLAES